MSKTKKKPLVIEDITEAEQAVKEIHKIETDLEYIAQCEARAIQKVKEKFDAKRLEADEKGLKARIKTLTAALHAYCKEQKKNWGLSQSLKMKYGTLSFHAGQPAVKLITSVSKKLDQALLKLKKIKSICHCYRIVEELDKEAILILRREYAQSDDVETVDDDLKLAGLKVVQEETFKVVTAAEKEIRERLEKRK